MITPTSAVHNRTGLTLEEIHALPLIGETVNKWRQRNVWLRQHPTDPARLISVGVAFDGSQTVVADEERSDWATALDYVARGEVYVSE